MATTQTTNDTTPTIDAAFEQVKELNEQVLAAARTAGNAYFESYEKTVDRTIDLELKAAGLTQQEWLKNLLEAQADVQREIAASYSAAARSLLK